MKKKVLVSFLASIVAIFAVIFLGGTEQTANAALNNTIMINKSSGATVYASPSSSDPAGRTLSNGSSWAYNSIQIGDGGNTYVMVAPNQWVNTNDTYKLGDENGNIYVNKLTYVYSSPTSGLTTQILPTNSTWAYNGVARQWNTSGLPAWVRVSTNGWVKATDVGAWK